MSPPSTGTRTETDPEIYDLDPNSPVMWSDVMSHHLVEGRHLWIGIDRGIVAILDEDEHRFFIDLQKGLSPALLLATLCRTNTRSIFIHEMWGKIFLLIEKLARKGFINGIDGYRDVRACCPEKFARLHITKRCQLSCIHCYAMSGPEIDSISEMSVFEWRQIIDDIAAARGESVLFTGGEPLIRNDCTELLYCAKRAGLRVTLFTNGLLVPERLSELKDYVDLVQVSLNGADKVTNDSIRGEGTFEAATFAVDRLVGADVAVRIGITVMERNWRSLEKNFTQLVQRYRDTCATFHLGYGVCNYGRARNLRDQLDLEEVRPILDEMAASANRSDAPRIARKTVNCGYGEQLVVAPDGYVYPCHLLDGALGHITDRPLTAWHTVLRETARAHSVDRLRECCECDLRNLCGGTCRVVNQRETGSMFNATCTPDERQARYRSLVRLFKEEKAQPGELLGEKRSRC